MLYRLAIVETTRHQWVVYKVRYQRLKDRMSLEHFVGDQLGRPWNSLAAATDYAREIHSVLERIQNQQDIIDDRREDEHIRLQCRSAMTSLLITLTALTGVKHP